MTVPENSRSREHYGNGVTYVFNGPMAYVKEHVKAMLYPDGPGSGQEIPPSQYDVENFGRPSGTRVVMHQPPAAGSRLVLIRVLPYSQDVDITNQGAFLPESLERGFDLLGMQIQQVGASLQQFLDTDPTALAVSSAEAAAVSEWNANQSRIQAASAAGSAIEAAQTVSDLRDDVDAIRDGQGAGQLVYQTWAELSAVAGVAGNGAQVIGDTGTHTDPVTSVTVQNEGAYVWDESAEAWRWVRPDGLALKADKSAVAEVAGAATATVRGELLEVHQDSDGNVAFALHSDGTHEFLKTKVGGFTIARSGPDAAEIDGRATWHGMYEQWAQSLDGDLADAIEVDIDDFGRVGRILWADGEVWVPSRGGPVELLEMISLPDGALAQNPNGGFTCTGLDKITTGQWKGCWVVGNHGLAAPGTGNTPSIVILSPDMRKIVREIPCLPLFPTIVSIQGVAWDTSDSTIWFVDKANQTLRHISAAGADLGDHIAVSHAINGLAYRADEDGLYAPAEGTANLNLYSCADGSLISTVSGISASTDQCHYYAPLDQVWITRGTNGTDGEYIAYSATTGQMVTRRTLPGSQSIEGLHFDGSVLTVVNDGAYHTEANPPLALACKYRIN